MLLESYMRDVAKMKEVTRTIVESGDKYEQNLPHNVSSLSSEVTDYFSSYSHFGIHQEMLNVSNCYKQYCHISLINNLLYSFILGIATYTS